MSDKIIDEVMELIDVYVFDSEENALYINSGVDSEAGLALLKQKRHSRSAIRAKLREVLERKPMQEGEIFNWWRGENGFEDHDMCKLQDFSEIVRAVEKRHNIK